MRRLLAFFAAPILAVAAVFTEAIDRAAALMRECLDLFAPGKPLVLVDAHGLTLNIGGTPNPAALLQSLRHEARSRVTGVPRNV